jgi:hypothetical protein
LPIPLDEYIKTFYKNVELYQENLDSVGSLQSGMLIFLNNSNITMDIVERYPNKDWNWYHLSLNQNIIIEIVERYPNHPWDWEGISKNPNIDFFLIISR